MKYRLQWLLFLILPILANGCRTTSGPVANANAAPTPAPVPAAPMPANADANRMTAVRFLEKRIRENPDDFVAYNKLTGYYLQLQRETGNVQYLELAERAAQSSLAVIPAAQNKGGLAGQIQVAYAAHRFTEARDLARQLTALEPDKPFAYQSLGDALLELGEYEEADKAFQQAEQIGGVTFGNEVRRARRAALRGDWNAANDSYTRALKLAQDAATPDAETIAWAQWQLGETAFARGRYADAEKQYQAALKTFPDYHRGLGGLARARAAQNDMPQAITLYEKLVKQLPDPLYIAALGDLYQLTGRANDAAAQYALVAQIAKLNALNGALYNRQLALFYADHDLEPEAAYNATAQEYETRRDVYGADALAWAALKAGKIPQAQVAMQDALRLGTKDAKLLYHAGMIARAAGKTPQAKEYLQQAITLSPRFDPLQAPLAEKALKQ